CSTGGSHVRPGKRPDHIGPYTETLSRRRRSRSTTRPGTHLLRCREGTSRCHGKTSSRAARRGCPGGIQFRAGRVAAESSPHSPTAGRSGGRAAQKGGCTPLVL